MDFVLTKPVLWVNTRHKIAAQAQVHLYYSAPGQKFDVKDPLEFRVIIFIISHFLPSNVQQFKDNKNQPETEELLLV